MLIENAASLSVQRQSTSLSQKSDDHGSGSMTITRGMTKSEGGRFLVHLELRDQAKAQADTHTEEQVRNFNLMR